MKRHLTLCVTFFLLLTGLSAFAQDTTYKQFLGKYRFPAGSVVDEAIVTWDNNALNMNSSAGTSVLEKIKGDTFNIVAFNGIAVFKRNAAGKVNGVHVDASGYVLEGELETAAAFMQRRLAQQTACALIFSNACILQDATAVNSFKKERGRYR